MKINFYNFLISIISVTITILGSGPSRSIPRDDCRCALCRDARRDGKSARTRSSILIQNKKTSALIDTSPDFLLQARREKIKKIDAVFFTHEHSDATGGFGDFVSWCREYGQHPQIFAEDAIINYLQRKFPSAKKIPIRPPLQRGDDGLSLLQREYPARAGGGISIRLIAPFTRVKIGSITVESFRVYHGLRSVPTLGYRINDKTIFISDFDGLPPKSARYLRDMKTMILDAAMWFGRKMKGHNTPKEAVAIAKRFNPKILYLTQTGHTWPPHDEAQKIIDKYAEEQGTPFSIIPTYDGLKIKI